MVEGVGAEPSVADLKYEHGTVDSKIFVRILFSQIALKDT